MRKCISEIDNFEDKSKKIVFRLGQMNNEFGEECFDIEKACISAHISLEELDDIIFYLKRGQIIETDHSNKIGKLTLYGRLLFEGEIKTGYVPC